MAGLQRSQVSFRRQGSSGLVWDDKFVSGEFNQPKEEKTNAAVAAVNSSRPAGLTIERSRSNGGRGFRTGRVSPAIEPPSPRVSACGLCGALGKSKQTRRRPPTSGRRVM
ncbi:hypothetical protein BUALT_Bualt07G0133100 [Buddleja alternifolia]|uniref:MAPK kinase substrate protein n=1 Tax=Buddleja alternifolia TaxID=168488 RepID=A0AAV6XBR2_9LAMI|nr:hypothetical protein BUALT_Bualt07G0133100 [Buddleja alternifolia]